MRCLGLAYPRACARLSDWPITGEAAGSTGKSICRPLEELHHVLLHHVLLHLPDCLQRRSPWTKAPSTSLLISRMRTQMEKRGLLYCGRSGNCVVSCTNKPPAQQSFGAGTCEAAGVAGRLLGWKPKVVMNGQLTKCGERKVWQIRWREKQLIPQLYSRFWC